MIQIPLGGPQSPGAALSMCDPIRIGRIGIGVGPYPLMMKLLRENERLKLHLEPFKLSRSRHADAEGIEAISRWSSVATPPDLQLVLECDAGGIVANRRCCHLPFPNCRDLRSDSSG